MGEQRKVPAFIWGSLGCWLGLGYSMNKGRQEGHGREAQFISHCGISPTSTPRKEAQNPGISSSLLLCGENYRKREYYGDILFLLKEQNIVPDDILSH